MAAVIGGPGWWVLLVLLVLLMDVGIRDLVQSSTRSSVLVQGADYANAPRAMMMAVGCIQAQTCHTNTCPVAVATQDPKRMRALDVPDKTGRVVRYQEAAVRQALQVIGSMGLDGPERFAPHMLRRRVDHHRTESYAELVEHLEDGQLLAEVPPTWQLDWALADPDRFTP